MNDGMWVPDISRIEGPRYLAVAAAIAKGIDNGELPPGTQLPPQRDLAEKLGVTVGTVSRAYALAKRRRLVDGEVGRGTFVKGDRQEARGARIIPESDSRTVDLACFRSPVDGLTEALAKAFTEVGERSSLFPLHKYPPASGFLTHRTAGAAWIGRVGFEVSPENVLLCGGAQQAIMIALTAFARSGETILTESLTYSGVKALAALHGIGLAGVAMDEDGMVPEALDAACQTTNARVVFLQPTVHNPTTALMPIERRRRIAEIARARDLILIEDDAAASALTDRPPPIAALAPERTCYITSVSKSVSPTFRLAYVAAAPKLLDSLASTFHTMALAVPPFTAEVMALMISNGVADQITRRYLHEMQRRHDVALDILKDYHVAAHPAAFYVWLTLPTHWHAEDFAAATKSEGVSVVSADSFAVGHNGFIQAVRVSLNPGSSIEVLKTGLKSLASILSSRPRLRPTII
jgi:DNA-binding transcriptional MocR family regulator